MTKHNCLRDFDVLYVYEFLGRRILEADILNRWIRHTEYRGLTMDVWKNAAVHGIKEPRDSRGIDSTGMVFKDMQDFLPAFADFSRGSPYDFTHVALTLPLGFGGDVLGLLQTEHSGIGFNPFVNASHTDAERHYFGKGHLGSVRAVTNQWGSPLRTYDYDVFGQPLQDRPERFHYGFTGKEYDSWTGLYNYGFRDYSATFGRFTTVDPIQDGNNWYAYVNSDPVSWLDPWGLTGQPSGEDSKRNEYPIGAFEYTYNELGEYVVDWDKHAERINKTNSEYIREIQTDAETPRMGEPEGRVFFFTRPAEGRITSEFGPREKIETKNGTTSPIHWGMDIANVEGTPVYPAESGYVIDKAYNKVFGNYVIINHEGESWTGLCTLYAHMSEPSSVNVGDIVTPDMCIGKMGATGMATGPHLHFEFRDIHGGTVVKKDPRDYIDF